MLIMMQGIYSNAGVEMRDLSKICIWYSPNPIKNLQTQTQVCTCEDVICH